MHISLCQKGVLLGIKILGDLLDCEERGFLMSDSRNAKHLAARSVARCRDSKPERLGMGGPHRKIHVLENHGVDGVVSLLDCDFRISSICCQGPGEHGGESLSFGWSHGACPSGHLQISASKKGRLGKTPRIS